MLDRCACSRGCRSRAQRALLPRVNPCPRGPSPCWRRSDSDSTQTAHTDSTHRQSKERAREAHRLCGGGLGRQGGVDAGRSVRRRLLHGHGGWCLGGHLVDELHVRRRHRLQPDAALRQRAVVGASCVVVVVAVLLLLCLVCCVGVALLCCAVVSALVLLCARLWHAALSCMRVCACVRIATRQTENARTLCENCLSTRARPEHTSTPSLSPRPPVSPPQYDQTRRSLQQSAVLVSTGHGVARYLSRPWQPEARRSAAACRSHPPAPGVHAAKNISTGPYSTGCTTSCSTHAPSQLTARSDSKLIARSARPPTWGSSGGTKKPSSPSVIACTTRRVSTARARSTLRCVCTTCVRTWCPWQHTDPQSRLWWSKEAVVQQRGERKEG